MYSKVCTNVLSLAICKLFIGVKNNAKIYVLYANENEQNNSNDNFRLPAQG